MQRAGRPPAASIADQPKARWLPVAFLHPDRPQRPSLERSGQRSGRQQCRQPLHARRRCRPPPLCTHTLTSTPLPWPCRTWQQVAQHLWCSRTAYAGWPCADSPRNACSRRQSGGQAETAGPAAPLRHRPPPAALQELPRQGPASGEERAQATACRWPVLALADSLRSQFMCPLLMLHHLSVCRLQTCCCCGSVPFPSPFSQQPWCQHWWRASRAISMRSVWHLCARCSSRCVQA